MSGLFGNSTSNSTIPTTLAFMPRSTSDIFNHISQLANKWFYAYVRPAVFYTGSRTVSPGRDLDGRIDTPTDVGFTIDFAKSSAWEFDHSLDTAYQLDAFVRAAAGQEKPQLFMDPPVGTPDSTLAAWAAKIFEVNPDTTVIMTQDNPAWRDAIEAIGPSLPGGSGSDSGTYAGDSRVLYVYAPQNQWSFAANGKTLNPEQVSAGLGIFDHTGKINHLVCEQIQTAFLNSINDPEACPPVGDYGWKCHMLPLADIAASGRPFTMSAATGISTDAVSALAGCGAPYLKLMDAKADDVLVQPFVKGLTEFYSTKACKELLMPTDKYDCALDFARTRTGIDWFYNQTTTTTSDRRVFVEGQNGYWQIMDQNKAAVAEFAGNGNQVDNLTVFGASFMSSFAYTGAVHGLSRATAYLKDSAKIATGNDRYFYGAGASITGLMSLTVAVGFPMFQAFYAMGVFANEKSMMTALGATAAVVGFMVQAGIALKGTGSAKNWFSHEWGLALSMVLSSAAVLSKAYGGGTEAAAFFGSLLGAAAFKLMRVVAGSECTKACFKHCFGTGEKDDAALSAPLLANGGPPPMGATAPTPPTAPTATISQDLEAGTAAPQRSNPTPSAQQPSAAQIERALRAARMREAPTTGQPEPATTQQPQAQPQAQATTTPLRAAANASSTQSASTGPRVELVESDDEDADSINTVDLL